MTTVIKLKRGTSTPTTSDIVSGEVAIDTSAQKLYVNDSGSIKLIGDGTGSALTIQEEGSSLATAASTLNFVGTGVTATGSGATKTITISAGGGFNVADNSSTQTTISPGETLKVAAGSGITTAISGDTLTITATGSASADLTSVSTDITPDTHNTHDVGQLGSSFRDFTFVRKLQKNVEIFTRALGLNTVAANLGFNINTGTANMTEVYTNAGGLDTPVLSSDNSTYDDSNPAFLF